MDRAHAHQVGAQRLQHADLGGGLVLRSGHAGVHALLERGIDLAGQVAQPLRVGLGEVDEPRQVELGGRRPGERRTAGEVDVVADQHRLAHVHPGPEPARRVGDDDGAAPARTAARTACTTTERSWPS